MHVRNANGGFDIRVRPQWEQWGCILRVKFDADMFDLQSIANLVMRAGFGGVGEGRPDSKMSAGMGWGTFSVTESK